MAANGPKAAQIKTAGETLARLCSTRICHLRAVHRHTIGGSTAHPKNCCQERWRVRNHALRDLVDSHARIIGAWRGSFRGAYRDFHGPATTLRSAACGSTHDMSRVRRCSDAGRVTSCRWLARYARGDDSPEPAAGYGLQIGSGRGAGQCAHGPDAASAGSVAGAATGADR